MDFSDLGHFAPSTHHINELFAAEVATLGGNVSDCFLDDNLLIARACLPMSDDVTPGDTIDGGVAIQVSGPKIVVHPYTLRQVCTNGAVMALSTGSTKLRRVEYDGIVPPSYETSALLEEISRAIQLCATPGAFGESIEDMRTAKLSS